MRALSLKQHWLYAITDLDKRIENRSWPPWPDIIGNRIALHASKKTDINSRAEIYRISGIVVPDHTPRGAIVATAVIRGYYEQGGYEDKWFFGECGWILDGVVKLDVPLNCKGMLSLWTVPHDIEAEIKHQLFRDGVLR